MKNKGITMNKHSSQKSHKSGRGFSELNIEHEDAHPDFNSTEEFLSLAEVDAADLGNQEEKELGVLGFAIAPGGLYEGIALQIGGSLEDVVVLPQNIVTSGGAALHGFLVHHGIEHHFGEKKERAILDWMKREANGKRVSVITQQGLNLVEHEGKKIKVYAWEGKAYQFENEKCSQYFLLTNSATEKMPKSGNSKTWKDEVISIAKDNPRLLAALSTTLSAATRRAFGKDGFIFGMTAPSSFGKTSIQEACSSMIQKPRVETWDGTALGNREYPEQCPDQPCCIDDVQQANFDDLAGVILGIGHDSKYSISKNANNSNKHPPIHTTGIFSSEDSLREMAGRKFKPGMAARYFEVGAAKKKYGMFDHSSGRKGTKVQIGKQIADELNLATSLNYGTVWPEWLQLLEANWETLCTWHAEHFSMVRNRILESSKVTVPDAISGRLLDSIAFAAFMGNAATELGFWSISKGKINRAFGLLFREYIEQRAPLRHALGADAVKHLAQYIRNHQSRFVPLEQYSEKGGNPGYLHRDAAKNTFFVFDPDEFHSLFVTKFGEQIYAALKDQGLLVHEEKRNQILMRIPKSKTKLRERLVSVRSEILQY
jgi:hypothetical protein